MRSTAGDGAFLLFSAESFSLSGWWLCLSRVQGGQQLDLLA